MEHPGLADLKLGSDLSGRESLIAIQFVAPLNLDARLCLQQSRVGRRTTRSVPGQPETAGECSGRHAVGNELTQVLATSTPRGSRG